MQINNPAAEKTVKIRGHYWRYPQQELAYYL